LENNHRRNQAARLTLFRLNGRSGDNGFSDAIDRYYRWILFLPAYYSAALILLGSGCYRWTHAIFSACKGAGHRPEPAI